LDVTILISQNSGIVEQSFSGCFMAVWHGGVAVVMCCLWLCDIVLVVPYYCLHCFFLIAVVVPTRTHADSTPHLPPSSPPTHSQQFQRMMKKCTVSEACSIHWKGYTQYDTALNGECIFQETFSARQGTM